MSFGLSGACFTAKPLTIKEGRELPKLNVCRKLLGAGAFRAATALLFAFSERPSNPSNVNLTRWCVAASADAAHAWRGDVPDDGLEDFLHQVGARWKPYVYAVCQRHLRFENIAELLLFLKIGRLVKRSIMDGRLPIDFSGLLRVLY